MDKMSACEAIEHLSLMKQGVDSPFDLTANINIMLVLLAEAKWQKHHRGCDREECEFLKEYWDNTQQCIVTDATECLHYRDCLCK